MGVRMPEWIRTAARMVKRTVCLVIVVLYAATLGGVLYPMMACPPSCTSDLGGIILPLLVMSFALAALQPSYRWMTLVR